MTLSLVLLFCPGPLLRPAAWAAQAAPPGAESILRTMEEVASRQRKADPLEARGLEEKLRDLAARIRELGPGAAPALSSYLSDRRRLIKIRLYAASLLGLIGEPGSYPALKETALDGREDPGLRSAALQAACSLRLDAPACRAPAEAVLKDSSTGELLAREALLQLSRVGADDAALMLRLAKRHGPAPEGHLLDSATHALRALALSKSRTQRELFKLAGYFKKGSEARRRAVEALALEKMSLSDMEPGELHALRSIALEDPLCAVEAARLLGELRDPGSVDALLRALRTQQKPRTLAEAAEALAKIGDASAAGPLAALASAMHQNPRFAPQGREEYREYAVRVQAAADFLAAPTPGRYETPQERALRPSKQEKPAAPADAPSASFSYEGWPGEGTPRPVFSGTSDSLTLYPEPSSPAEPARSHPLRKGRPLTVEGSVVRTLAPGILRARKAMEAPLRDLGESRPLRQAEHSGPSEKSKVFLLEGEALEILAYRPQGACFLRRGARIYEGECLSEAAQGLFTTVSDPKTEWWLKTTVPGASGWFRSDDPAVDFLQR